MSIGTPLITTKIGGNPELITHGVEGILVGYNEREEWKEALLLTLRESEQAHERAERAKRKSENFPQEKMIDSLLRILRAYGD